MPKKFQFIAVSLSVTLALSLINKLAPSLQPWGIIAISLTSYFVSAYLLRYDLTGIEFITLLALPSFFTFAVGSVLYYFPNFSLAFRSLILFLFGLSFYLTLLSENIFNVGRDRPIPLLKAAGTVSFLLTLFTAFLLFTVLYKTGFPVFVQCLLVVIISFVLAFQSLWTLVLGHTWDRQVIWGSLILALAELELAVGISFLPFESFFRALALSTGFYVFLGTAYNYQRKTLKNRIFIEYAVVAVIVIFLLIKL